MREFALQTKLEPPFGNHRLQTLGFSTRRKKNVGLPKQRRFSVLFFALFSAFLAVKRLHSCVFLIFYPMLSSSQLRSFQPPTSTEAKKTQVFTKKHGFSNVFFGGGGGSLLHVCRVWLHRFALHYLALTCILGKLSTHQNPPPQQQLQQQQQQTAALQDCLL